MSSSPTEYERPTTLEEVYALLGRDADVKLTAGGQSLSLLLRQGLVDPDVVVDISDTAELTGVSRANGTLRIGAATTYAAVRDHEVAETYEELGAAIDLIADPQVRNLGTLGGALSHADPALDIIAPLLCLDASVQIGGIDGRRTVRLSDFFSGFMQTELRDGELIEAIEVEHPQPGRGSYRKHSKIKGGWAIVGVAARVSLSDDGESVNTARIALTAVDDSAVRIPAAEATLVGHPPSEGRIGLAAETVREEIDPVSDVSGSERYKRMLSEELTRRALTDIVDELRSDTR